MSDTIRCFVIMPFGRNEKEEIMFNSIFEKGIQPCVSNMLSSKVILHRADMRRESPRLIESVHKQIDDSHICIADITGKNPNVFYEIGYAFSKNKDIILISQDKAPYPVDIAHLIVEKYEYKDSSLELLSQKLSILITNTIGKLNIIEKIDEATEQAVHDEYEIKCYANRKAANLNKALREAEKTIDILETNLYTIANIYLNDIKIALEKNKNLRLQILTLNPESFFTQKRAEQLGLEISHYRFELHESIKTIIDELSIFGGQFSLKIYDDFPSQITFMVDKDVYNCTVARSGKSRDLCTFKLNKFAGGVERSFIFHFNLIWQMSQPYLSHTLRTFLQIPKET